MKKLSPFFVLALVACRSKPELDPATGLYLTPQFPDWPSIVLGAVGALMVAYVVVRFLRDRRGK